MAINSYDDFINKPASEKITLVHIHAAKRLSNFTTDTGLYSQVVEQVVVDISNRTTKLVSVNSKSEVTDSSKFFYEFSSSKVYLYAFNSDTDKIIATFRLFLSNAPINTSWNLEDSGEKVSYDPIIQSIPKFKSQMTQGKKGINLMGFGSIVCDNVGRHFDSIYDKYVFDNKKATIYSYNRELPPSKTKLIFRGRVTGKVYNDDKVTFKVTDDIYALKQKVSGSQYLDDVIESDRLRFKRHVYGKVDNLQIQSISQAESGIVLAGTLSGTNKSSSVYGIGTDFINELSSGDEVMIAGLKLTVDIVLNDKTFTVTSPLAKSFYNSEAISKPETAYYRSNRTFQVSNHALKEYSTTITNILARNRLEVVDASGFNANDLITIEGTEAKKIKRVSGNQIVLTSNYNLVHSVGGVVSTDAITSLGYSNRGLSLRLDDFTIDNSSAGAFITLSDKAEINAAEEKALKYNFYFRNGHSKVWLGTPTIFKFDTVANTSGSLLRKYFLIYDEEGDSVAYWFTDDVPEGTSTLSEPLHGAGSSYKVKLKARDYTGSEIAEICLSRVLETMDLYTGFSESGSFTLETTQTVPVTFGTAGDSGFTATNLAAGVATNVDLDLNDIISSRNFIRDLDSIVEYEVLAADSKMIYLRTPYMGPTTYSNLIYKNVEYVQDDTPVYISCRGKTKDGTPSGDLITTAGDVVSDLIDGAGLGAFKDTASFAKANESAPQLVSLALPFSFKGDMPPIKEVVNRLNASVIGSLFVNQNLDLGYNILDASIDIASLRTITDDDIISWSASGDGFDISKTTIGNYRPLDFDPAKGEESNLQVTYTSSYVEEYVGNDNTSELNLYLYDTDETQEQVERDQLINSLSNTTIKINGSLNLSKYKLGERVVLNLRRLYKAVGGDERLQVAVITSIDNNGQDVKLELENLGALYSRAAVISADDSVDDYSTSTSEQKLTTSFVMDDNGLINNSEDTDNTSLIS